MIALKIDLREDWPDGGICVCGIVVVPLQGGAVYINGGTGTFTDCTFTSNTAVSCHCSYFEGTCKHLTVVVCVALLLLRVYFAARKSCGACE